MNVVILLARGAPSVNELFAVGLLVVLVAGFALGTVAAKRVQAPTVRKLILILAAVGGLAAVIKGVI